MCNMETQCIADSLISYLREAYTTPDLIYSTPLKRLQGGFETASYSIALENQPDTLPGALVLRLYPERYGPNPATWEAAVQNSLFAQDYPVAQVHHVCTDTVILGGAFILMDLIPGIPMAYTDLEAVPTLLGTLHAELHNRNPERFIASLTTHGIDPARCILDHSASRLRQIADDMPWLGDILAWMQDHSPAEPTQLAACHGDFHPMNIMVDAGQVSGVLDWGGFAFADPNYDIGNTLILIAIPLKYLATQLEGFPVYDVDQLIQTYLTAYQRKRNIDFTSLDFFMVRRCVLALIQGQQGEKVWQYPPIVQELTTLIQEKTRIALMRSSG
jgi:aminoglycoside phosphotransferase (APT) family kinase protein